LDGKRRLQIPHEFRTAVPGVEHKLMCLVSTDSQYLEAGGDSLAALYMQRIEALTFGTDERDALETAFFTTQRSLTYDGGGRITLPEHQCQKVGLGKDVVILGKGQRFQIWDAARWAEREVELMALAGRVLRGQA
jgi:Uncharacterized protein conserved in bacteria